MISTLHFWKPLWVFSNHLGQQRTLNYFYCDVMQMNVAFIDSFYAVSSASCCGWCNKWMNLLL